MERAALGWSLNVDAGGGEKLRKVGWNSRRKKQCVCFAGAEGEERQSGEVDPTIGKAKASRGIGGDIGLR